MEQNGEMGWRDWKQSVKIQRDGELGWADGYNGKIGCKVLRCTWGGV